MQNELVVKSNQVIEASYRLSVVEQRLFYRLSLKYLR